MSMRVVLMLALGGALLVACSNNGAGTPNPALGFEAQVAASSDASMLANLSGQYGGRLVDNMKGTEDAAASFAQTKSAVGGTLHIKGKYAAVGAVSWNLSGATVSGDNVFAYSGGYCTFAVSGKYSSPSHKLTGSYHAVHGCTGEKGTYSLTHQCVYSGSAQAIQPENGLKPC